MSILYLDIFSILYSINYMSILYLDIYHCIIFFRYIVLIIIKISISQKKIVKWHANHNNLW